MRKPCGCGTKAPQERGYSKACNCGLQAQIRWGGPPSPCGAGITGRGERCIVKIKENIHMSQKLPLFGPDNSASNPPRPLASAGESLWNRIQVEYAISDAGGIELLAQCCEALDRAQEL